MVKRNKKYKELSRVILQEILEKKPNFKENNPQAYFYKKERENPESYRNLSFDCNTNTPFSKTLCFIIYDFKNAGYINFDNTVTEKQFERIKEYLSREQEIT